MTNPRVFRLGLVILLIWLIGAAASWVMLDPVDALVGARTGGGGPAPVYDLAPNDLIEAKNGLSKSTFWGIQRDGKERPPEVKAKEVEEKKIEWRILGAVSKGKERYVLIQIDKGIPVTVKEGEQLPDGSQLLSIIPNKLSVMTSDGQQKTINLNLD